jgi:flavin reductase (DIM6/NTAB) family NADH-FMN oxidoreductase RutF
MGFTFSKGENFDLLLVDDSALMMECKVVEQATRGDHTVFIGEVVYEKHDASLKPLLYHSGKYWGVGRELPHPAKEERKNMEAFVEKHTK